MDFGRLPDIDSVDFTLKPDAWQTIELFKELKNKPAKNPEIHVGCAKWGRKDWIGQVYPAGTKEKDFFSIYAKNFDAIELNATHYRIPTAKTVLDWKSKVDKNFRFSPKFVNTISHFQRLKKAEAATASFYEAILLIGEKLGTTFLQMPPNFSPKSYNDLANYFKDLPKEVKICLELRQHSWFLDESVRDETLEMLKENNIGTVITDAAGEREVVHMALTTDEAFIRFVGNSLHPTDYKRIDDWVTRLKSWLDNGLKSLYFYMHQHEEQYSPVLCDYFIDQMNKKCGLKLKRPHLLNEDKGLFEK